MRFIGHRGASHVAPENTIAAVKAALTDGFGFEVDVQTLACGRLVVLHDDTLERTASPATSVSQGLLCQSVEELHWDDVRDIDVGSWYGPQFSNERVPLFADVLRALVSAVKAHCGNNQMPHCFAELKASEPFDPALPAAAAAEVATAGVPSSALTWISFSRHLLVEMKRATPQYASVLIADAQTVDEAWAVAHECVRCGLDGIDLRAITSVVTAELVGWLHARGKTVSVWVGRAPAQEDNPSIWACLEAHGVDDFTSNLPPAVHEWRRNRGLRRFTVCQTAASVVASTSVAYVACRAAVGDRSAEDIVDLAHSLIASAVSARVAASVLHIPDRLTLSRSSDRIAHTFIVASSAYFSCDVALVLCSLARGVYPRQWRGRLAHHAIQAVANIPALFSAPPAAAVVRKYLLLAYAAEFSTIVLRLKALARATNIGGERTQRFLHSLLLGSFVLFRMLLFPTCTRLIWKARAALPPELFRLHLTFAGAGIALSSGWFVQLLRQERARGP